MLSIVWTEYLQYRAELRGFDLAKLEQIIRHSSERYFDTETGRTIVIGRHDKQLGQFRERPKGPNSFLERKRRERKITFVVAAYLSCPPFLFQANG